MNLQQKNKTCVRVLNESTVARIRAVVLFLYNRKLHFLLYKKPPAGCALRRILKMSQATTAGARMCQGTFFVLAKHTTKRYIDNTFRLPRTGAA
ncbi:hypothetical protein DXD84_03690 [Dorea formicigenerans]|uniref:Uncharacterized protein n=1 Tax=Dorea formicigenerans TaxID=39486 RepID=A0A3E4F9A2_9FIRM|nr:hypothetical protein DXD84_03690 [Dorea formicigenerans]RGK48668.1 hypothetical protein DXD10_06870 [Dorea formicigenerans]RGO51174.1 hypothetical protein DXB12_07540 [Dorea formicigenerans]